MPLLYFVVGSIGVLLGAVLRRLTGLRWWIPPLALLGAAWLYFLSSIWWRPRRHTTRLSTELLSAVAPQRGEARRRREHAARLLASGFPFLGFEGDPHDAWIGGSSWSSDGVQQITTQHADGRTITVTDAALAGEDMGRAEAHDQLFTLHPDAHAPAMSAQDGRGTILGGAGLDLEKPAWIEAELVIDGRSIPAYRAYAFGGTAWYARHGPHWVTIVVPGEMPVPALRRLDAKERDRVVRAR